MTIPGEQAAAAALLRELAGADPIETHISAVFVGAETVYKLRKAVRLSFVDFTSVGERHRTARRELALNQAAAPGLYRDVVPITRPAGGALALGGDGEAVDWVVRMSRVPAADFLDVMAQAGPLDPAMLDALADNLAAYHAGLSASNRPADGSVAAFGRVIDGNAEAAHAAGLPGGEVERWRSQAVMALDARAGWMARRAADGFVRRAHGDLHLGNVCLWQGRPVPFDALEFDEDLATIDVGYDLAFMLMDLDHRAGRAAAARVLNRTLARSGDIGLLRGLPLFLSVRAMVRAHVEASRGRPGAARGYLDRAHAYLAPPPPVLVAVGGLPGTGKSTLARALAPELGAAPGAVVLRSDEIRKRRHGVAPEHRLPDSAYSESESRAVLEALVEHARSALAAGHSVIADATFMDPHDRAAIAAVAGATRFHGFWLTAPLATLEQRIAARRNDASDATVEIVRAAASAVVAHTWTPVDAAVQAAALQAVRSRLLT